MSSLNCSIFPQATLNLLGFYDITIMCFPSERRVLKVVKENRVKAQSSIIKSLFFHAPQPDKIACTLKTSIVDIKNTD